MDPQGKVALVTGAGYGIGRGIALRLAAAGASVVVDDIDNAHGNETVGLIEEADGKATYVNADVVNEEDVKRMITFAEETFGGLDILVNNAGGAGKEPYYPYVGPEAWRPVLDWYLYSYMLVTQVGMKAMRKHGGGAVVSIASMAGVGFRPYVWPEYAAAKAGVMRFTATLGGLKERDNIRVNCICPGWVATEAVREYLATWTDERKAERDVPDPMLTPSDIGGAVLDFVRDESMAGRVLLYRNPGDQVLIPEDAEY